MRLASHTILEIENSTYLESVLQDSGNINDDIIHHMLGWMDKIEPLESCVIRDTI